MPLAFLTSSHHTTRPLTDPDRESIKSLSYQTALHSPQQSGVIIASIRNLSHRHRSERAHAGCKCQKLPTDVPCDCRRLSGTVLNFRIHIPHLASSECMADGSVSCQNVGHHRAGARALTPIDVINRIAQSACTRCCFFLQSRATNRGWVVD